MPEISIIVPVYKVEKYLNRCVKSILNQTFTDFELILVDDGSPDRCPTMCDEWEKKDHRIKVIHKENGGLSSARNAGLDVACGNFIGFVDSDDWIEEDMYELLHRIIVKHNADIAMCGYFFTDGFQNPPIVKENIVVFDNAKLMNFFFRITKGIKSNYSVCNRLYRRKLMKGVSFPDGVMNEDVYYSYYIFIKTSCAVISNLPKYNYFINNEGLTRSALKKQDVSLYYVWDEVLEHTQKYNHSYYAKALLNRKRAIFTLLSKYVIHGRQDYDYISDEWIKEQTKQLRKAYILLMKSGCFDVKRKVALLLLCVSPKMMHGSVMVIKGIGLKIESKLHVF